MSVPRGLSPRVWGTRSRLRRPCSTRPSRCRMRGRRSAPQGRRRGDLQGRRPPARTAVSDRHRLPGRRHPGSTAADARTAPLAAGESPATCRAGCSVTPSWALTRARRTRSISGPAGEVQRHVGAALGQEAVGHVHAELMAEVDDHRPRGRHTVDATLPPTTVACPPIRGTRARSYRSVLDRLTGRPTFAATAGTVVNACAPPRVGTEMTRWGHGLFRDSRMISARGCCSVEVLLLLVGTHIDEAKGVIPVATGSRRVASQSPRAERPLP